MSNSGNKITVGCLKKPLCSCVQFLGNGKLFSKFSYDGDCDALQLFLALFLSKALCKQQLVETDEVICVQNVLSRCYTLCISPEKAWHNHQQQILSLNIGQAVERTARPGPFLPDPGCKEKKKTNLWGWPSSGIWYPEKLGNLHPWNFSRPDWTWPSAIGSKFSNWSCFEQTLGWRLPKFLSSLNDSLILG